MSACQRSITLLWRSCEAEGSRKYPALLSVPGAECAVSWAGNDGRARHHHLAGGNSRHPGHHGSVRLRLAGRRAWRTTSPSDSTIATATITAGVSRLRPRQRLSDQPSKWDGVHLAVTGGSQGGALSIVTAALDPRVKGLAAYYPHSRMSPVFAESRRRLAAYVPRGRGPMAHRSADKIETRATTTWSTSRAGLKCPAFTPGALTMRRARRRPCTRLTT
jgi:hypothetical protein